MKSVLRWIAIIVLTPIALFILTLTMISILGITVNLDKVRPMVAKAASGVLDRQVKITGPMVQPDGDFIQ